MVPSIVEPVGNVSVASALGSPSVRVPNPNGAVAQYGLTRRFGETAAAASRWTRARQSSTELSTCLPARSATSWPSSTAISAPAASAARSTCLVLTSTPANSRNSPLLSAKLTRAAALAVMRRTPGVSENDSSRRARSRGQNPP
jgi:hypothetical protein